MADFTITISNRLNCFGVAPSDKWGAYNWNDFLWGEGTADLQTLVDHPISETLTLTDAFYKSVTKAVTETLTIDADMGSEGLRQGDWSYVFVSNTTEGEDRDFATWSSGTAGSTSWSSSTATSTTWS